MITKIENFINKYNMLSKGDSVVCGLSGGADSVCLLLSICELSEKLGISVEAIHVNHCLRGEESDRDERFCAELCERLEIKFTAVSCDVKSYAKEKGISIEDSARKLRYGVFANYSKGKKIATAHNANDNLETVILNLARGTALKGISGIPPIRGNIIRPLLTVTRTEIENFLTEKNQSYVTDSTNLSDDYTRNKIRHKIIPLLEEINSSAIATSVNSIDSLRTENALIENLTEKALENCRVGNKLNEIGEYEEVIRRRCVAKILSDNNLPYSYDRLSEADKIIKNGGKINVSGDFFLVSDKNCIELKKITSDENILLSTELKIGENSIFSGKIIKCELISPNDINKFEIVHRNLTFYLMDYDKIKGRVFIRNRKFGDRIRLNGKGFTSSVKKLINEKISEEKRKTMHFIEDEEGTVFAEYLGIAERVAPDGNTVRLLKITVY